MAHTMVWFSDHIDPYFLTEQTTSATKQDYAQMSTADLSEYE